MLGPHAGWVSATAVDVDSELIGLRAERRCSLLSLSVLLVAATNRVAPTTPAPWRDW